MATFSECALTLVIASIAVFAALTMLDAAIRVLILGPVLCPRCDRRFGSVAAFRAQRVICHFQWEADYRPKIGETADCVRSIECQECEHEFVYNLRRTRLEDFESDIA